MWKKLLGKLFGTQENGSYTEDELITIVEEAQIGGSIGKEQQELITNAIEFDDLEAIDVITPRVDIVAVELGTSVEEIGRTFKESGLSRLPVYEDDLDNIIGIINQKDFHNYVVGENRELEQYIKPVDHWVAFALLAYIGIKMIWDATHERTMKKTKSWKNPNWI